MEALKKNSAVPSLFDTIHGDSKGIVEIVNFNTFGRVDKINRQYGTLVRHYYEDMFMKHLDKDLYFSLNSFSKLNRRQENLLELKALWSDLDYYKTKYTKNQVLYAIEDMVHNNELPQPTFIVDSGRGIYLIWKIARTPPQALERWRNIMLYIHNKLIDYGADRACVEPSRVLRLDGSINSKSKKSVEVINYTGAIYNLYTLNKDYLSLPQRKIEEPLRTTTNKPINRTKNKKYRTNGKNVLYLHNQYKTYLSRLQDIETLCLLRNYEIEKYHCRELILFLTKYWTWCATKNEELSLAKVIELNAKFDKPLSAKEVSQRVKINEKAQRLQAYRYSNNTLIEILKISEEEQFQLSSIHSKKVQLKKLDIARKEERRNKEGLTPRQVQKIEQENKIKNLVAKGLTNKEISEKCKLTIRRVQQIRKAIGI